MSAGEISATTLEIKPSRLQKQMLRFLVVGGSSVAVDLICYWFLLAHFDRVSAKGISYQAGVLVGFAGNKLWTFESRRRSLAEPVLYIVVYAITLLINVIVNSTVCWVMEYLGIAVSVTQTIAFLIATGVTTILNFVGLKYIAFRRSQMEHQG